MTFDLDSWLLVIILTLSRPKVEGNVHGHRIVFIFGCGRTLHGDVFYRCTLKHDAFLFVCQVLYAKVVTASWSEGFLALLYSVLMLLAFIIRLCFSQLLDSLASALWRCSRVWIYLRRKWTDLDEVWSTRSKSYIFWDWQISGAIRAIAELETQAKFCCFFCQVNNARLHRFPVGQISRNLNTTRPLVRRWCGLCQITLTTFVFLSKDVNKKTHTQHGCYAVLLSHARDTRRWILGRVECTK